MTTRLFVVVAALLLLSACREDVLPTAPTPIMPPPTNLPTGIAQGPS